ncbi:MAG: hypothetical protein AOA66_1087 [Candidatus Bathyarchaeota archaeon BA2]|nr:MAG: hypothetical protein AOA66_1087 [Candidatus Bathyarchaeota archaeon BA2]
MGEVGTIEIEKKGIGKAKVGLIISVIAIAILVVSNLWLYIHCNAINHAYQAIVTKVNLHTKLDSDLITPDDSDVRSMVNSITGGWSNPDDVNEFWDDCKKLFELVRDNVEYRYDGYYPVLPDEPSWGLFFMEDMYQLPKQTLDCRKGDCDDKAVLLTSMLRCYTNRKYDIYCIYVAGSEGGHIGTLFPVAGDKICFVDATLDYCTSTGFPSYSITGKDIQEEVNYYMERFGFDRVYKIFSDDIVLDFSSTEDFINWMYTTA